MNSQTERQLVLTLEQPAHAGCGVVPCSALGLATAAWQKKQDGIAKQDLPLEFAAIIHGDGADDIADQLEYIAYRMRETGWNAGNGGGKGRCFVSRTLSPATGHQVAARISGSALWPVGCGVWFCVLKILPKQPDD